MPSVFGMRVPTAPIKIVLVVLVVFMVFLVRSIPRIPWPPPPPPRARELIEIKGAELALRAMLADSGRSDFNQFFVRPVLGDPTDPAQWRAAIEVYTNVFYTLLHQGRNADAVSLGLDPEAVARLGGSYMDLPPDPFDIQHQFCPGPWTFAHVPIVFRSWRDSGEEDSNDEYVAYVYDAKAKALADAASPGNPPPDNTDGFPAPKEQVMVYIWSNGENRQCDQLFGEFYGQSGEEYKGGGDDICSWDSENGYDRFY